MRTAAPRESTSAPIRPATTSSTPRSTVAVSSFSTASSTTHSGHRYRRPRHLVAAVDSGAPVARTPGDDSESGEHHDGAEAEGHVQVDGVADSADHEQS